METDFKQSEKWLQKAQELYMIDGKAERGFMSLCKFVKAEYDKYADSGSQDREVF